jgi:hypothetical protein
MPTWLRRLNIHFLNESIKKEKEQFDKSKGKGKTLSSPPPNMSKFKK